MRAPGADAAAARLFESGETIAPDSGAAALAA